jgi:hypothetical protein
VEFKTLNKNDRLDVQGCNNFSVQFELLQETIYKSVQCSWH